MIHTWLHEVSAFQNPYADLQLVHFYRYVGAKMFPGNKKKSLESWILGDTCMWWHMLGGMLICYGGICFHADSIFEYIIVFFLIYLRWLSNPGSLLYDPALCRLVQGMMKKLFLQVEYRLFVCFFIRWCTYSLVSLILCSIRTLYCVRFSRCCARIIFQRCWRAPCGLHSK